MAFIETIEQEDAEGRLAEVYDNLVETRGKLASVHKIQSLNPESIVKHMELYLHIMFSKSPLKRYQREMIAVVVSLANKCEYCTLHHAEALDHFWKDKSRLEQFKLDYRKASLNDIDLALCQQAERLTLKPSEDNEAYVAQLKELGLTDRSILDCSLVISYFNFVNRMVLSLGVNVESEGAGGYEYN